MPTQDQTTGTRVLVVDDDEAVRRPVSRVLRANGYLVVEAHDGREAAGLLGGARFDCIVSDINMPGMDGIALLKTVRVRDADVPVVLLTGVPDLKTAISAIELGAYRYLPKPIDPAQLTDVVRKAVSLGRFARIKREAIELSGLGRGSSDLVGLAADFERALESMWIAYQPIVRVTDRALFGHEALCRSREPSLPHASAILDAAERLERLADLGQIIRDRASVPMAGIDGALFVNLHPRDLEDDALLSEKAPLSRIGHRVVLEITERAALSNIRDLSHRIKQLRALGFRLAIDDLGAGYSGLTSFAHLEPDVVKLDMSLIRDVEHSDTKRKVIGSMTRLCREMGVLIVAEGIETALERDVLVDLGCDLLQGYLFARPGRPFPTFRWDG